MNPQVALPGSEPRPSVSKNVSLLTADIGREAVREVWLITAPKDAATGAVPPASSALRVVSSKAGSHPGKCSECLFHVYRHNYLTTLTATEV